MAFRGRGRGRGGFGGGGGFGYARQEPFKLFPPVELGKAEFSPKDIELIKWSTNLQKYLNSSPYFYEDRGERIDKTQKQDIERYSDRKSQTTKAKPPLWHFIKLDTDHFPAELARGEKKGKHVPKRVRWNSESDYQKLDMFEKLEQKYQGQEGTEKKDDDEEDENAVIEESDESADDGDYEENVHFDDDEDDFNMPSDNNDEGEY